ncbi:MAG: rhodanese-like domain-containing protein [Spirochaetes bacterium]|nr:rhodanese-like domain-containing protein [Spirochaetota bacterium]
MKKKIILIISILMFFALFSCLAINNSKVKPDLKKYLSSAELEKLIEKIKSGEEKDIVIVDVRPASVYDRAHVPTAVNIPNGMTNNAFNHLKDKDLILYCETGGRVEFAKKNMIKDGFKKERLLNFGGFTNYKGKIEN